MEYFQRVSRLVEKFNELNFEQSYGEYLLKHFCLDVLEEMFGLV